MSQSGGRSMRRLFQVLPDEGSKVLHFALLAGLLQAGVAIGMVAADSMFLANLGVEKLPLVYIMMPVVMAVYAPIYSVLQSRLGTPELLRWTLIVLTAGGLLFGFGGEQFGNQTWYLFAMKFYAGMWFIALYTMFWNFADDFFSILDSKRLYGLISAGSSAGAMLGGGLVTLLSGLVPASKLFLIWTTVAMASLPVYMLLRRRHQVIASDGDGEQQVSPLELLGFIRRTFKNSGFALALAVICFAMVALASTLEYLTFGVLESGRSADELASLLGQLYAIAGAATLVINLFVFNRLVGWLGVRNVALIVPIAFLGAFVFFYLHYGFAAALVAFYAYQTLFVAIEYNNLNLLFNALPMAVKRQLRAFIEAMAEPAATATAGVLLFYFSADLGSSNLALTGLLAACVALGIAAYIRNDYARALAVNLRSDFLDFANPDAAWRQHLVPTDLTLLRQIAFGGERGQQLLAVELLWRLRDPAARGALLHVLSEADADEAERLRPAIASLIRDGDTEVLAETMLWLESEQAPRVPEVLDEFTATGAFPVRRLQAWRRSDHPAHLAAIAVARWNGRQLVESSLAVDEIRHLLAGDEESKRWAIRAIGDCRHSRHAQELFGFLRPDQDPALRMEALRSLRKLANPDSDDMLPAVLPLAREARSGERALILGIAERVGDTASIGELLWAAEHFSSSESRQLEAVIAGMGLKAIPAVISMARNTAAPFHSRSIAVRALSRLAMPQLMLITQELIEAELKRAEDSVVAKRSLKAHPHGGVGQTVLVRYYRDAAAEGLEFVLELMSLTGQLPDFDLIRASLSFANARDRANAIETIQQSCARPMFERIAALIDATVSIVGLQRGESEGALLPVASVLRRAAESTVALEASAGLIAFQEQGIAGGFEILRARLDRPQGGRIQEWLIGLLPRFTETGVHFPLQAHPVERVAALVRADFFSDARILALDYLASHAQERSWGDGEVVYGVEEPTEELYVITHGDVEIHRGALHWVANAGTTFGERVLMGDKTRRDKVVSRGASALVMQGETVSRAIEIFPAMGVSLYQFKTISAVS